MIVASLMLALSAMSSVDSDPVDRAFGVTLLGPESQLSTLGFEQSGPTLSMYWYKTEAAGFFSTIEAITQNGLVREINGWKYYTGSDNTTRFVDCAADAEGIVEVIRARHPALEAIDVPDEKQDERNGARTFRKMLSVDKTLKESSARRVAVLCMPSYHGEDQVDLLVSYRLSHDESAAANAQTKALRREGHRRRVLSEGVKPADF